MSISSCDEVVSIFGKRDGLDLSADLIGSNLDIIFPVPNIDDHVMLRPNWYDVFIVWRSKCLVKTNKTIGKILLKCMSNLSYHTIDPKFMPRKLCNHLFVFNIPHPHTGQMSAFSRNDVSAIFWESKASDGFARSVDQMTLTILSRIVQHHCASVTNTWCIF